MSEEWRGVPGYDDLYRVSNLGRVASRPRHGTLGGLLNPSKLQAGGYLTVVLFRGGNGLRVRVHVLVMLAFVGWKPDGMEIRHLDGDPTNNALANLAYGTHGENMRDRRQHGTDHQVAKTHCPRGHPYDEANTYVLPSRPNARYCRACRRFRGKPAHERKRAA